MDLNLIVNDTLSTLKSEGYVENIVKKQLEDTIKDVVHDALRSYSVFGKQLKKEIESNLAINLEKLDIPSYNQVILNMIQEEINQSIYKEGMETIKEQVQELLGTSKVEYKLSELIKEMVKDDLELNELGYDEVSEITVIVEEKYGNTYIYLDPEEDKSWHYCKYMISLEKDGTVWRAETGGKKHDNRTIMGGMYGLDATIFKMWTHKAKLVIDDYETEFSNPDYN
ncbi:hypothetical protein [Paenibacillus sp. L3-i20]|uniref:hypothetical protein n=1 Tax=Paenibacillus sp. L3-i20 TaxID=2905833 RepID=UPI001EDF535B|nr:hypothetical protein [Paenibacillus sp. L3-i20]GKU76876.1 hypothetical protein L3i20_v212730 [Paenibacillus sp. L3-i20]